MSKPIPLLILTAAITAQAGPPRAVADELLAADAAASAASAKTTAIPGLTAMFAQDVTRRRSRFSRSGVARARPRPGVTSRSKNAPVS